MALAPHLRPVDMATPIPHSLSAFSYAGALVSGLLGGLAFSGLLWLARLMGMTGFSVSMFIGSLFTGETTTAALWLGLGFHLVLSMLTGLVYALLFHAWGWSTWARGIAIAIPHAILAGLAMTAVSYIHPVTSDKLLANPGFLAGNYDWLSAVILFALFLVYGAIVGSLYARYIPHLDPAHPEASTPLP